MESTRPTQKCSLIKSTVKNLHINSHTYTHTRRLTLNGRRLWKICIELERWVHFKCQIDKFVWMVCSARMEDTLFGHHWKRGRVRASRVSMVYRNHQQKKRFTLFTMQSGIFIGFCDVRFFLLELLGIPTAITKKIRTMFISGCAIQFYLPEHYDCHGIRSIYVCKCAIPDCGQRPPKGLLLQLGN